MSLGADELLGLQALTKLNGSSDTAPDDVEKLANGLLKYGMTAKLREAGLPWAPTPEQVEERLRNPRPAPAAPAPAAAARAGAARPAGTAPGATAPKRSKIGTVWADRRVKAGVLIPVGIFMLVVLIGGYGFKWSWTGFETNNQLWDWLHLILLPVAFGTIPLWLRYSEHMSNRRKMILAAVIVAFIGFIIAGYLVPINWTGFSGNSLWNWLTLIVLPVTLITFRAWPSSPRELRPTHISALTVIVVAWVVTLIGGYVATWHWTGYEGNTLWDWMSLLLAPLVITTMLVPTAVRFVSGDAARRAQEANRQRAAEAARQAAAKKAATQQAAAPGAQA
jgi:hypothetical protein